MTSDATSTSTSRVRALAGAEVRLLLRNRTVAVSSLLVPVGLGVLCAFPVRTEGGPVAFAVVIALQLALVLGIGVYATVTQTLVVRRQTRVLERMRTTCLADAELLIATVLPIVLLGLAQLAVFAVVDVLTGVPAPADPVPLVLAVVGGLAWGITAGLATGVATPTPERARITTLPMVFVLLGAAIVLAIAPLGGWWQALVVVPGGAVGQLARLAMTGTTWEAALGGLPAVVPALIALVAWPVVFGVLAVRRFRWGPRHRPRGA
ncbi:ABC transporter permease [Pseudonocardia kunmingensis]|uniref:ABC-2 type transport system permease protein n=1 Tax=Pseudonocardia kunmingensis TaxID=630975 RepID=A0A543E335_9PSEU|nr:ABC transporter permease [Pseudonocardia kunmingensis]TQM15998.1 ABC-2 type transport system permease protein [Pseudonocardia kunmingensis]